MLQVRTVGQDRAVPLRHLRENRRQMHLDGWTDPVMLLKNSAVGPTSPQPGSVWRRRRMSTPATPSRSDGRTGPAARPPNPPTAGRLQTFFGRVPAASRFLHFRCFIKPRVDCGNLCHPTAPLEMFQSHHFGMWPVEVICNEGYLLVERLKGVADYPPRAGSSMANACAHLGQVTAGGSSRFSSL